MISTEELGGMTSEEPLVAPPDQWPREASEALDQVIGGMEGQVLDRAPRSQGDRRTMNVIGRRENKVALRCKRTHHGILSLPGINSTKKLVTDEVLIGHARGSPLYTEKNKFSGRGISRPEHSGRRNKMS